MNLLVQVLSQYQLLELLANYVSTKDLYHLGRTCSELFSCIVKPANTFTRLKRVSLCDGSGLKARQNYDSPLYNGLQSLGIMNWRLMPGQRRRSCHCQEEVEVRVWGKNCDEVNALPCVKCGINVCEECRYVPRIRSTSGYDVPRRPHFNRTQEISNIVCYCDECEPAAEKLADDKFCECDVYTRWICHQCRVKEREEVIAYERNFAKFHSNPLAEDEFMVLDDHQGHRAYWCPCGQPAPPTGKVRCIWCKRKHPTNIITDRIDIPRTRIVYPNEDPSWVPLLDEEIP